MLSLEERAVVWDLLSAGIGVSEVARRTGWSTGTIYNIKKSREIGKEAVPSAESEIPQQLITVQGFIDERLKMGARNVRKLFLAAQTHGYQGSYRLLQQYVSQQRKPKKPYRRSQHIETKPGEQAQVDWGSFGKIEIDGQMEPLYAFVYILSYSRALYVEFVIRQNQQTLHSCHEHAFAKLGVPRNIRYDNMKTVVLSREHLGDGTSKPRLNSAFKDFARYYGFNIEVCPPYWPRAKGKVESSVKYVRHNFMDQQISGKTFKTLAELNEQASQWLDNVAQKRVHRTTETQPLQRWLEEKPFLQFPTLPPYSSTPFLTRRSTKDGLVQYKRNLYAVPMRCAQKKLAIREIAEHGVAYLEIFYQNCLVTKHKVSFERGKWVLDGQDMDTSTSSGSSGPTARADKRPDVTVIPRGLHHYNNFIPSKGV